MRGWQRLQTIWQGWLRPDLPLRWPLVLGVCALVFWLVYQVNIQNDWSLTFYPAGQNWLDPYENSFHLVYPPWLAVILAPFTLFPEDVGRGLFAAFSVAVTAYAIHRLEGGFVTLLLVLLTPFYVTVLVRGETDALPLAGLGLALQGSFVGQLVGLLLLVLKPQTMGLAAAFLFLFLFPHKDERRLFHLFSPRQIQLAVGFGLVLLLSFLVYGWWLGDIVTRLPDLYRVDDVTPWPWGIPVGLLLLYHAYRQRSLPWAALATYFFVPYLNWYSLSGYAAIIFSWSPRWFAAALLFLSWVWFLNYTT